MRWCHGWPSKLVGMGQITWFHDAAARIRARHPDGVTSHLGEERGRVITIHPARGKTYNRQ